MFFASTSAIGQTSQIVKYKTNADSQKKQDEVVKSIENLSGVVAAIFTDDNSNVVVVRYKKSKVNKTKIENTITKLNYTAKQVKRRKSCCSKKASGCGK